MNILLTCVGRRNYLVNFFKESLKDSGKVYATDVQASAPGMVDADLSFIVPSVYDSGYIDALVQLIKDHHINAVVSLNDLELPILAKNKSRIEATGAKLIVSDSEIIDTAFDKIKTNHFIENIGLNVPATYTSITKAKEAIEAGRLQFPLVVKPRWGSASIGLDFPEDLEELEFVFQLQKKRLVRSMLSTASQSDIENEILIQEKIRGEEYGLDILNDFEGNYIGTFVRKKLSMRSGETDKAISIIDERFNTVGKLISKNLKHIGNLDCDVFDCNGELFVLELNPRFGGGYPFSHLAGAHTTSAYISWLKGDKDVLKHLSYQAYQAFSKYDNLMKIEV